MQGGFRNTVLASSAVVKQLNALPGLDVTALMLRGVETGTAGPIDIRTRVAFPAQVLFLVIGRDIVSVGVYYILEKLRATLQDGVGMVTSHGEASHQSI